MLELLDVASNWCVDQTAVRSMLESNTSRIIIESFVALVKDGIELRLALEE
jgi:hypothetical protein